MYFLKIHFFEGAAEEMYFLREQFRKYIFEGVVLKMYVWVSIFEFYFEMYFLRKQFWIKKRQNFFKKKQTKRKKIKKLFETKKNEKK